MYSFGVNHHPYRAGLEEPFVIGLVELDDQADLRLTTNIVGCEPSEVFIGMEVAVVFERHDDVHIPLFQPVRNGECDDREIG